MLHSYVIKTKLMCTFLTLQTILCLFQIFGGTLRCTAINVDKRLHNFFKGSILQLRRGDLTGILCWVESMETRNFMDMVSCCIVGLFLCCHVVVFSNNVQGPASLIFCERESL